MNVDHLLKQTCTVYTSGMQDMFGKKTESGGTDVPCRFQKTTRIIAGVQREREPVDGILWLKAGQIVTVGDKIVFNSVNYRVMKVEPIIDRNGVTRHNEVLVQDWNV